VNIVDFWKRWHITLNRFFTSYVYIPLGGNRRGRGRMYLNFLVVFFLSGVWHGAGWNFIVWGMLHGVLYVLTRWYLESKKLHGKEAFPGKQVQAKWDLAISGRQKIMTFVSRVALFLYVSIAWVYFRAADVAQANSLLLLALKGKAQKISFDLAECFQLDELWYVLKVLRLDRFSYSRYLLMFFMLAAGLCLAMFGQNAARLAERMKGKAYQAVLLGAVFVWCILSFSQVSTFLYFNF
ncbi:MAG: MBOAT family protein, partial [Lachnospiraceae bacterium]|nr:MBOAT family protein [Lachnospiraceae bacterium]